VDEDALETDDRGRGKEDEVRRRMVRAGCRDRELGEERRLDEAVAVREEVAAL
jgi:hypothetical protein